MRMATRDGKAARAAGVPGTDVAGRAGDAAPPAMHRVTYFLRKVLHARIMAAHALAHLKSLGHRAEAVDQVAYAMADRRSIGRGIALGLVDGGFAGSCADALAAEFEAAIARQLSGGPSRVLARVDALSAAESGEADFVRKARATLIAKGMLALDQSVVFAAADTALRRAVARLAVVDGYSVGLRADSDLRIRAMQAVDRDLRNGALAAGEAAGGD